MLSSCSVIVNGGDVHIILNKPPEKKKSMDLRFSDLGGPFIVHNCHLHSAGTRKWSVV